MKWGKMTDHLIEKAEDGDEDPQALIEQPAQPAHLEPVAELFWILSNQRPFISGGMGPSIPRPLTVADIWAAAPEWGIDPAYFLRVTAPADELYIQTAIRQLQK